MWIVSYASGCLPNEEMYQWKNGGIIYTNKAEGKTPQAQGGGDNQRLML